MDGDFDDCAMIGSSTSRRTARIPRNTNRRNTMLETLKRQPHPLRQAFTDAGLDTSDVARFLGLSLGRAQQLLSGRDTPPARIEAKFQELAKLCEADAE
jgi:hypothetical protein